MLASDAILMMGGRSFGQAGRPSRAQSARAAAKAWGEVRTEASLARVIARLAGRTMGLQDLSAVKLSNAEGSRHYAGVRTVALGQIRGSEGRSHDFDAQFRPLKSHNRERWINIATARLQGLTLPPVELIQVDGAYYVRDGNHRVSVAKALGQQSIDAVVTVW